MPAMSLSGPWVTDAGIVVRKETSGAAWSAIGAPQILLANGADRKAREHHRRDRSRYCGSPAALAVHFPFRRHTRPLA